MLRRSPRALFTGLFAVFFVSLILLAPLPALTQTLDSAQPTVSAAAPSAPAVAKIDTGDTSWMLISTALVLLMTPGLALFYGGMVRRKNVLGTMMHSFIMMAMV